MRNLPTGKSSLMKNLGPKDHNLVFGWTPLTFEKSVAVVDHVLLPLVVVWKWQAIQITCCQNKSEFPNSVILDFPKVNFMFVDSLGCQLVRENIMQMADIGSSNFQTGFKLKTLMDWWKRVTKKHFWSKNDRNRILALHGVQLKVDSTWIGLTLVCLPQLKSPIQSNRVLDVAHVLNFSSANICGKIGCNLSGLPSFCVCRQQLVLCVCGCVAWPTDLIPPKWETMSEYGNSRNWFRHQNYS